MGVSIRCREPRDGVVVASYALGPVVSELESLVATRSRHAQITEQKDSRLGDRDCRRVSEQRPCCVTDAQVASTGWAYHVYRVQGWRTYGRGTDWSRDVFQDRAHTLLPWPDVPEPQG